MDRDTDEDEDLVFDDGDYFTLRKVARAFGAESSYLLEWVHF